MPRLLTRERLLTAMRRRRYAIQSSVDADHRPQSAIVGVAVSDAFDVVFDTLGTSRKAGNLRARRSISLAFGSLEGQDEETVQFDGTADEPEGAERDRLVAMYLAVFPDGRDRQRWPHLTYFRARPRWIRYSNYNVVPPAIVELDADALEHLR